MLAAFPNLDWRPSDLLFPAPPASNPLRSVRFQERSKYRSVSADSVFRSTVHSHLLFGQHGRSRGRVLSLQINYRLFHQPNVLLKVNLVPSNLRDRDIRGLSRFRALSMPRPDRLPYSTEICQFWGLVPSPSKFLWSEQNTDYPPRPVNGDGLFR